jgi:two-component sensor histidine kinase
MLHERNVVMADDVRQDLLQMRDVALNMYEEIRTDLAQLRLHPTADLLSAVAAHTRSVADQTGLTIQVTTHGEPVAILPPVTQQIVGLLREGLANIQRHAQARSALIALTWLPEILMIVLSDDGAGFDPQDVSEGHYGLIMMAERTADLGGELHINSERGNGTCLTFRFSLPVLQSGKPTARQDSSNSMRSLNMEPLQVVSFVLDLLLVVAAIVYLARPRIGGELSVGLRILLVGVIILGLAHLRNGAVCALNESLQLNEVIHRLLVATCLSLSYWIYQNAPGV